MHCEECQELLSEYIDGTLELGDETRVERHLTSCSECLAVRDDLLQIVSISRHLPQLTPSYELWTQIRNEMKTQSERGAISRFLARMGSFSLREFSISFGQVSALVLLFSILGGVGFLLLQGVISREPVKKEEVTNAANSQTIVQTQHDINTPEPGLEELEGHINQLRAVIEVRQAQWNPELKTSYDRSLIHIDQSLADCRQALKQDPSDRVSQELMLDAYREKARVLEGFADFGSESGTH